MENIIFSSAHPDDITGSAGTMLRLKNRYKIHMVDMTRGESGMLREKVSFDECAAIRTAEEEAVAKMLNADLHFLGEKDIFGEGFAGRPLSAPAPASSRISPVILSASEGSVSPSFQTTESNGPMRGLARRVVAPHRQCGAAPV